MARERHIRTLIVDDEAAARRGVRLLLDAEPDIEIVGECGTGREGLAAVLDLEPDLVFLDIQMPDLDGFEMLRRIDSGRRPVVVFVTAYDEYALRAFEAHALDYLLKPYGNDRFREAVARARTTLRHQSADALRERLASLLDDAAPEAGAGRFGAPDAASTIAVRHGTRLIVVSLDDVEWIGAEGDYAALHVGTRRYLHRATMRSMEARLPATRFVRIHRSTIVRLDVIVEIRPHSSGRYELVLKDGTVRRISSAGRRRLEAMLGTSL